MTSETETRPHKVQIGVSLPPEIARRIDELAAAESLSRSTWVRRLIVGSTRPEAAEA